MATINSPKQTYRIAYYAEASVALFLFLILAWTYLVVKTPISLAILSVVWLCTLAVVHFGSAKVIIENDTLAKEKFFGLISHKVALNSLTTVNMYYAYFGRYGIVDWKVILTDSSDHSTRFWVNYYAPRWHRQGQLLKVIDEYVHKSGAIYNKKASSMLARSSVKEFS